MAANYIVCLAHFCELHGPSTIICTQVAKPSSQDKHILAPNSRVQTCSSCDLYIPDGSANIITRDTLHHRSHSSGDSSMVFISNHYPSSQSRYTALTKLVMKSLSVETSSDISKPMFYGDAVNGYCINKIFTIKDINARGSERKYALMVISDFETDILSNWDIIGLYFNEVINLIQERVHKTVEEQSAHKTSANGNNVSGLLDNEKYLRRSMIKPKSLIELTDDNHIFVKFHLWAIELLKDVLR